MRRTRKQLSQGRITSQT